jgi:hemolysin activation/secretion protein
MIASSVRQIRSATTGFERVVRLAALVGLGLLIASTPAVAAQQLSQIQEQRLPPDATGRIEQRFREAPTPPSSAQPPVLQVEPPPPAEAPESAANIPLQIEELTLTGVTVYQHDELKEYWKDKIGKPGTLGDLFVIANEITARYRNDGYVLSRALVPAQEIEDGKVQLRVIEGYVAQVVFEGDDDRPDLLRATGERITEARPVRVSDLERYLLLLTDSPGITVSSVLKPSAEETGAADLVIKLERDPIQSFTTIDNRGTRYVGPVQYTIGTKLNSVFGLGDQTFIRGITTPLFPNELMAFDLNNTQYLNEEGTTLSLNLNFAEAHPGFTLTPFKLTSDASTIAFALTHPLIRSRVENLHLSAQFVANQYRTGAASSADPILRDNVRSIRLSATYDWLDSYKGANLAVLGFSQGLDVFGASKSGSPFLSRAAGRSDYNKLNFDLSRFQSLGDGFAFVSGATAQIALTPLLASEQFGLGGSTFLRAYDPSDIVGDSGIGAKFQLEYSEQPKTWYLQDYTAYTYLDLGRTQNLKTGPGEKSSDAGISLGLGSRFTLTEWANGYIEVSQPIMRGVLTEGTHDHFPRLFFALIAKF